MVSYISITTVDRLGQIGLLCTKWILPCNIIKRRIRIYQKIVRSGSGSFETETNPDLELCVKLWGEHTQHYYTLLYSHGFCNSGKRTWRRPPRPPPRPPPAPPVPLYPPLPRQKRIPKCLADFQKDYLLCVQARDLKRTCAMEGMSQTDF